MFTIYIYSKYIILIKDHELQVCKGLLAFIILAKVEKGINLTKYNHLSLTRFSNITKDSKVTKYSKFRHKTPK